VKVIVEHIISSASSNQFLYKRFSTKVPQYLSKCVGVSVITEFTNFDDKLALSLQNKDVHTPIGMLSLSFNNRNTAAIFVPVTQEPILYDGAIDYDIEVPLSSANEICGHFVNHFLQHDISNLNIKLIYKLI